MSRLAEFVYQVNASDHLVYANERWYEFAFENITGGLGASRVIGHLIWDFISDATTRELYKALMAKVRSDGMPATIEFRCDSPEQRRNMTLELHPLPDRGIEFRTRTLQTEQRAPIRLFDADAVRTNQLVTVCGWCKKVRITDGQWAEVEEAVNALGLFAQVRLPRISHGICDPCFSKVNEEIDRDDCPSAAATGQTLAPSGQPSSR